MHNNIQISANIGNNYFNAYAKELKVTFIKENKKYNEYADSTRPFSCNVTAAASVILDRKTSNVLTMVDMITEYITTS